MPAYVFIGSFFACGTCLGIKLLTDLRAIFRRYPEYGE